MSLVMLPWNSESVVARQAAAGGFGLWALGLGLDGDGIHAPPLDSILRFSRRVQFLGRCNRRCR